MSGALMLVPVWAMWETPLMAARAFKEEILTPGAETSDFNRASAIGRWLAEGAGVGADRWLCW
jgi:hypothetical protein